MALSKLYGAFPLHVWQKKIDLINDDIRVMLLGNGYTPNQDTHDFLDDVVANELAAGGGYTAGGAALGTKAISFNTTTRKAVFTAATVTWAGATFSTYYAVVYSHTPATDATRPLIGYIDFQGVQSPAGVPFNIIWSGNVIEVLIA